MLKNFVILIFFLIFNLHSNEKKINEIIIGISSIRDVEELINNKEKYQLNTINNIETPYLSDKTLDPRLWSYN